MATPLTYDQHRAACARWGIDLELWPGSRDLCRCHNGSHDRGERPSGRAWGPVYGVMNHITAGFFGSLHSYLQWLISGDPKTPLKAQFVIDQTGQVWFLSAGRCNHAGTISSRARALSQQDAWSLDKAYDPHQGHDIDGNPHYYGIEVIATSRMNEAQYASLVKLNAALSAAHGWTGQGSCGHGEASDQRGQGDPNLNMGRFRRDVMAAIAAGPTAEKPTVASASTSRKPISYSVWMRAVTGELRGQRTGNMTLVQIRLVEMGFLKLPDGHKPSGVWDQDTWRAWDAFLAAKGFARGPEGRPQPGAFTTLFAESPSWEGVR